MECLPMMFRTSKAKPYGFLVIFLCLTNFFAATANGEEIAPVNINRRAFVIALDSIMKSFAADKQEIEKKTNRSLIIGYSQTSNLPDDMQNMILKRIEELAVESPFTINLPRCLECLTLTAEIEDGDIFIKRGVTNSDDLEEYFKKYKVTTYLTINLTYYSDTLSLQLSIYNATDRNVIFAKNYTAPIKNVPEKGFTFGLSVGTLSLRDDTIDLLSGGAVSVGQYIDGVGNIGLSAGSYANQDKNLVTLFGVFSNINMNDVMGAYWNFGYISLTGNLGFILLRSHSQLTFGPGMQFNVGNIFNLYLKYGINKKIGTLVGKSEDIKEGTIDPTTSVPPYINVGLGIDL
jgi:hypothetical protein